MPTHTLSSERIERLNGLREKMKQAGIAAYIIPGTDPHNSEYIASRWKGRDWLSGFTGSAGTLAVTMDGGRLHTDSRYFLQAEEQLEGSGLELLKANENRDPGYINWLIEVLEDGEKVGIDGQVFSMSQVKTMKEKFGKIGLELKNVGDLLDEIWEKRPEVPINPVIDHDTRFAGKSRTEKLKLIREAMMEKGVNIHLLTALDDIAWAFNLRGSDIPFNPVTIAFGLIEEEKAVLFIEQQKLSLELRGKLENDGITLLPYDNISSYLGDLSDECSMLIDPGNVNQELFESITEDVIIMRGGSIPHELKAIKNETEIANTRKVMVKDGVALVRFFKWLEESVGNTEVTELSAMEKLYELRAAQADLKGESFNTISGYRGHGAIIHYGATEASNVSLNPSGLYLLDSGGQYLDGTTDITRTVTLGNPTKEEITDFTLVLKGHIALDTAIYLQGTTGGQLDILARRDMWAHGINFAHGTGHGVGFYLNVHEGPQRIGRGTTGGFNTPLESGMITSNEPGIYREGKHGIRIENLVLTIPFKETEFGTFLGFETLTWCPIDTRLIDKSMMTQKEIDWLNAYHAKVYEKLAPHLGEEERVWLEEKTRII